MNPWGGDFQDQVQENIQADAMDEELANAQAEAARLRVCQSLMFYTCMPLCVIAFKSLHTHTHTHTHTNC